ncbi:related to myosin heavy chain [Cephalotrichum gorgonifer]|uniref:Related to myosin heavy chain n=1 Tax=Cephalotrichum gorgonifer TaxID=2041049 RepID=A0AAE8SSR2_9PEZI|nr:related to myosin heavy chain [Cephalotrichum gorgonifer]
MKIAIVKTSPQQSPPSRPAARDGSPDPSRAQSPALSTTSTADCELGYSPVLPPLPAPILPARALELLRTPPNEPEDDRYITASWGSPYPDTHHDHLRQESFSSENSEDSPIHQLDLHTPFLRPTPELSRELAEQSNYAFVSASVLANRARRQTRGLTEDWIRQHTASDLEEARLWLSDGTADHEPSSLSGSVSSDHGWLEPYDLRTPRANPNNPLARRVSGRLPRTRSSVETLTPEALARMTGSPVATNRMSSSNHDQLPTSGVSDTPALSPEEQPPTPYTSIPPMSVPAPVPVLDQEAKVQKSPSKASPSRSKVSDPAARVQRPKKKVPWKGKNILVLLPLDDERGQPGKPPLPMTQIDVQKMWKSWDELGYNTRGFDLNHDDTQAECESSQSRAFWPSHADMAREHRERKFTVMLPDLNAWKNYVAELAEAKLRALGVSGVDEDLGPLPSVSPVDSNASRIPSSQHPGMPFSPPIPTSSASSNPFPFATTHSMPGGRASSVTSPGIQSTASPFGHHGKYNPRQSISIPASSSPFQIPPQASPHNWAQQALFMQGISRGDSPLSLNGIASPTSPFQQTGSPGFNTHQRHQSLQYPILPHQQSSYFPQRATPTLQELREVDEEVPSKSPSKTPEALNQNPHGLQAEIDDAEYHLEEQLRNELEHDDYSPHHDNDQGKAFHIPNADYFPTSHGRHQSVQFAMPDHAARNSGPAPVLHHPRPHSRGRSLGHNFFMGNDDARDIGAEDRSFSSFKLPAEPAASKSDDVDEIQTNPSNLGTPVQDFDLASALQQNMHRRGFSGASNPWDNSSVASNPVSGHMSHGSKSSFSKLNVQAPEFKFNPQNTFKPAQEQFVFGGNTFQPQPTILQTNPVTQPLPHSATSSLFSMSTGSKINATAPVFSPGQSEFSFSTSGPKFRPDAPAFTPSGATFSDAITSPVSGSESSKRESSMFGNITIPVAEMVKPAKKSKAIPIVRPSSRQSSPAAPDGTHGDADGRRPMTDDSRIKRARAFVSDDGDEVPLFADSPHAEDLPASPQPADLEKTPQPDTALDNGSGDEAAERADTSMSSMMASEATDAKPTAPTSASSPSEVSPRWGSFEFDSRAEMQSFNHALPVGDAPPFFRGHKKSLSATAKPFTPGVLFQKDEPEATDDESVNDGEVEVVDEVEQVCDAEQVDEIEHVDDKEIPASETFNPDAPAFEPVAFNPNATAFNPSTTAFSPTAKSFEPAPFNPAVVEFKPQWEEPEAEEPHQSVEETSEGAAEEEEPASPPQAPVLHRVPQGMAASRFASPPPKPRGLAASRFAASPSPEPQVEQPSPVSSKDGEWEPEAIERQISATPEPFKEEVHEDEPAAVKEAASPTFEEIDAVMRHIDATDPYKGVNYRADSPLQWRQPSPTRQLPLPVATTDSPFHLPPTEHLRSDAPSPSPRRYLALPGEIDHPIMTTELDDPFVEAPGSDHPYEGTVHRLNASRTLPASEWDEDFSEVEQDKLEHRVQFFDGRINDVVGAVLSSRLDPVERSLDVIQRALSKMSGRGVSAHRDRRSTSREEESDADDEDDEPGHHRSMSPQRSKRGDQIRAAVLDALASHQRATLAPVSADPLPVQDNQVILKALEEMKQEFGTNLRLDFRGEDLRNIVEDAVERRMPPTPQPDEESNRKLEEMKAKILDLENRLASEQARAEAEIAARREAQDAAAELQRALSGAESKLEMEVVNRKMLDEVVVDLNEDLRNQKQATEALVNGLNEDLRAQKQTSEELHNGRRAAEDRLSEVQRLLRISTEEEDRLRDTLHDREQRIKSLEEASGEATMRLALLEAAQTSATQSTSELTNKINTMEADLRGARQEVNHWRQEAEHASKSSQRLEADLGEALHKKKYLHKLLDTLGTQLEENERLRDDYRSKFIAVQENMAHAASQVTEENARRTKREQALIARQEVLDARLQAEAKTRERLETELERLEGIERQGMRAVNELKRMEALVAELRTENHQISQAAMRHQREFEDARESGANEVQRVRIAMQSQLDEANHQVNVVREDLEEQILRLKNDLDHSRLDVDSAKAQTEMLLEEAHSTKDAEIQQLTIKHQNEIEDMQTRHDRQFSTAVDDAQSREQRLLERLSISTSRTEHLQDRIIHLEEKLAISKEAAHAAAQAARTSSSPELVTSPPASQQKNIRAMELPEKISPQALRESIMVLQEQLQEREQRIEELQHTVEDLDPDAPAKISKRDDEIIWLRELLAVRHGDLQDIITALSTESYDKDAVRDAVIRLKANLQMEEQERERAMNGGSSVRLPNIAQTIRDAATPRVAQAVGPIAAAWGSWRKAQPSFGSFSGVLSSPAAASARNDTPSKAGVSDRASNLMGGLMTPPASGLRQTPPAAYPSTQPTAFTATGRRFTGQQSDRDSRSSISSRRAEKMPALGTPPPRHAELAQPVTPPPMMERSGYDPDASAGDFDDHGFFDDDD